ncbi:transposase [Elysia marginata]|uniref:Transposase n=1 Tax=Elysia marginata TaxID=1093978 RepID=A0AAV4EV56_9GAST|nr:transposase [Elysia marginata]
MVRNYEEKTTRGTFSKDVMEAAVNTVLSGTSIRKAAEQFDLNYKTLGRYVLLQQKNGTLGGISFGYESEKRRIFASQLEALLIDYVIESSNIYYGLTFKDLRTLAYEVAVKNQLKIPTSWEENKMAGEDWMVSFRARHEDKLS